MTASATVDLPQPDWPTRPTRSSGMMVQAKSITAGISPARVKKEMLRSSRSKIGVVMGSIFQGLLAQPVSQQVETENQRHQRQCRRQRGMRMDRQLLAPLVDGHAPVRAF